MTYLLALLYLFCVYVRPGEMVPGWESFPFAAILAGVSAAGIAGAQFVRPRPFWNMPHDGFVLGFLVAVILSNLVSGWLPDACEGALAVAPGVFCYFLMRSAVTSASRLRWTGLALVAMTLVHAVNGIAQYHTGVGLGDVAALDQADETEDETNGEHGEDPPAAVRRIRGTGIFNDPNDLALAFVIAAPFLAGPLFRRSTRIPARIAAAALLVPLVTALYYTNSRGGVLGLGAALLPYAYRRFGRLFGPVAAAAGLVVLLGFGPSRMSALDASEASAQGRVESWSEGLLMFQSRPLFGVGYGRYTLFNDLVAHNSFVHTLAELGLIGAFCFVGMGYWFFHRAPRHAGESDATPDVTAPIGRLLAWGGDLRQSGLGLTVCMMFLSRQYTVVPFIWLALSGCYRDVLQQDNTSVADDRVMVHLARVAVITIAAIACTYLTVRFLSGGYD